MSGAEKSESGAKVLITHEKTALWLGAVAGGWPCSGARGSFVAANRGLWHNVCVKELGEHA